MERNFMELLQAQWAKGNFVCVDLNSRLDKVPQRDKDFYTEHKADLVDAMIPFNTAIIQATRDIASAYKLGLVSYMAYGYEGLAVLQRAVEKIHEIAPDVLIILDANYGGITAKENADSAQYAFVILRADAVTVNPVGVDALAPFLDRTDKGVIVLCGGRDFQNMPLVVSNNTITALEKSLRRDLHIFEPALHQFVAFCARDRWNANGNCMLAAEALRSEALADVRKIVGDMPIFVLPEQRDGVPLGVQVQKIVTAAKDSQGKGFLLSSSDAIFASNGPDFADVARDRVRQMRNLIRQHL